MSIVNAWRTSVCIFYYYYLCTKAVLVWVSVASPALLSVSVDGSAHVCLSLFHVWHLSLVVCDCLLSLAFIALIF